MGNEILKFLEENENDFVPALSQRGSVKEYYDSLDECNFIIIRSSGKIVGILVFDTRKSVVCDDDVVYIINILIDKEYRGKGIANKLYNMLFTLCGNVRYEIRTWSTNYKQLHILEKLGFELIKKVCNDRGEGIDTVYFAMELSE